MLQKGLKQDFPTSIPQLAMHYISACKKVYGKAPYIHKRLFPKFSVFEDDLRYEGIASRDYAFTVAVLMVKFCQQHKFAYLPINTFLGDYCLKRYRKVLEAKTVSIEMTTDEDTLLRDELTVARLFIDRNVNSDNYVRLSAIVKDIEPLLSKTWLQVYVNRGKRPELDAISTLADEFGISNPVTSYIDIVMALR